MVYTDGSCIACPDTATQCLGSAVYIPDHDVAAAGALPQAPGGASHSYVSNGLGPTNTINRAELVAVWRALQFPNVNDIATDSAVALATIDRYAKNPASMREHKHRPLLEAICSDIQKRPLGSPLRLFKVISHAGIVGNEMADAAAGLAAGGRPSHGAAREHAGAWRDLTGRTSRTRPPRLPPRLRLWTVWARPSRHG